MSPHPLILTLDQHGIPHRWISWQHACFYYAKDLVAWTIGEVSFVIHGGVNRVTGEQSQIEANSIIAIRGKALAGKTLHQVPPLSNRELFHRDRHICCSAIYRPRKNCYTPSWRGFSPCNSFSHRNGAPTAKYGFLVEPIVTPKRLRAYGGRP
jgi:hypothetical protein